MGIVEIISKEPLFFDHNYSSTFIRSLLNKNRDLIYSRDHQGRTPIDKAREKNRINLVRFLNQEASIWSMGCFPTTNESREDSVTSEIRSAPIVGPRFIGTSCFEILNLVSLRPNIRYIDVIDVSKKVKEFWEEILSILQKNEHRLNAYSEIDTFLNLNQRVLYGSVPYYKDLNKRALEALVNSDSFLFSDDRYRQIHLMAKEGHIRIVSCDLGDFSEIDNLVKEYSQEKIGLDCIYVSNIREVLPREKQPKFDYFVEKIRSLNRTGRAHLIRSETIEQEDRIQQIFDRGYPSIQLRVAYLLEQAGIEQPHQVEEDDW